MIAFTNSIVAGVGVTLFLDGFLGSDRIGLALSVGVAATATLMAVFLAHQRRRYGAFERATPLEDPR